MSGAQTPEQKARQQIERGARGHGLGDPGPRGREPGRSPRRRAARVRHGARPWRRGLPPLRRRPAGRSRGGKQAGHPPSSVEFQIEHYGQGLPPELTAPISTPSTPDVDFLVEFETGSPDPCSPNSRPRRPQHRPVVWRDARTSTRTTPRGQILRLLSCAWLHAAAQSTETHRDTEPNCHAESRVTSRRCCTSSRWSQLAALERGVQP
jgi:hypothetical protein